MSDHRTRRGVAYDDWLLPMGWGPYYVDTSRFISISPEEAMRRTPEADAEPAPRLIVAGEADLAWTLAMGEARRLESEGRLTEANNVRLRAMCGQRRVMR